MDTETILGLATSNRRQLDLGQENWRGNYKDTGVGNKVQGQTYKEKQEKLKPET